MKNTILIIIVLFLYGCGFSSIYLGKGFNDIKINITKTEGNREMNNLIKNELKLYSNKDSTNIYNLKINTIYKKEVLTKDASGNIQDYTLSITSKFEVELDNEKRLIVIKDSADIKNQSNSFDQNVYEKNIKINFATLIREELLSKIFNIYDN